MPHRPVVLNDRVKEIADAYRDSGYNVSETARRLGLSRGTVQPYIKAANDHGYLKDEELNAPNVPKMQDYLAAKERKRAAYQAKKRKGDWRKPIVTHLPGKPFRLKLFGDLHLDNDACNFELLEKHWMDMDAANGVYGVTIGDLFDNWLRVLGHLWKEKSTNPSDDWLLFEHLMSERGDALIAGCSGNHCDWSHGPSDPIDMIMKRYGVRYRKGAIRLQVHCEGCEPFHIALRHIWQGRSIYSPAHGLRRAAEKGWADLIMVAGHTHQDEDRHYVDIATNKISHLFQLSAFKDFDEFVDVKGFMGPRILPVRELVVNPLAEDTNPDKVKAFYNIEEAADYHAMLLARG